MEALSLLFLIAAGGLFLAGRAGLRRGQQAFAAAASGLAPARDLSHLPGELGRTALWCLSDGGFERRIVHGMLSRGGYDVAVTGFDLETLRERRGEWAYLPVEPPFRIGGVVSVILCEVDRTFPHVLLKRAGTGDLLQADSVIDRASHIAKSARAAFGVPSSVPAELPPTLSPAPLVPSPAPQWRAYGDPVVVQDLIAGGLAAALAAADRRDLVIELLGSMIVVYPAARDVDGADAFADLTATALAVCDGIIAASAVLSPRGVEPSATPRRPGTPAS